MTYAAPARRLFLAAAAAFALAACSGAGAGTVSNEDMAMGKANAPITVVEYASTTCGHCAAFNETVFPAFKKKYVDTGQVRYVLREFLTSAPEIDAAGWMIARCAGKDKYFTVVDTLFRSQPETFANGGANARGVLLRTAQAAGMTEAQFNKCVSDEAALKALTKRIDAGQKAGISATPTFVVNGKIMEGAPTLANLDKAIAAAKKPA